MGLTVDRLLVREGLAREQSRCSLVARGDHVVLTRLALNTEMDGQASSSATALDLYQRLATLWNFDISAHSWPVFARLIRRGLAPEPGESSFGGRSAVSAPKLDFKVSTISAGELMEKKTFIQRQESICIF